MKQVKRILCLVLACVLMCSLLPMTALAADVIVKSIEFSVGHIQAGAGGTDLLVTINEYQPVSFTGRSVLRHDNAGAYGNIVKSSEKLEAGKNYWLCVNLELKSGYTFTPYMMQQPSTWKINNLPEGVSVDKISMSGSNIKFRLTALPSFTPAFIEEPEDTAMEMETDVYDAQWEVNFVPHKYEYYCGDSRYQSSAYTITQKKFSNTFGVNHYYKFFIRAYYGKGENDYIDSSKFSIRVPGMYCIETDTQGGDPVPGGWPITNKLGKLETMPVTENGIMIFEGWYTAPTGGEKVTTETVFEKDSVIYARWKAPVTYNIIAGNYGVYYLGGSADTLPFTIDCDYSKFTGVEWNGEMLNPSYYTAKAGKSGTTVVELKKAFLETLTHESYAFRFMCSDGQAYASFTVKEIPTYTVTFNANGGSAVAAQTVKKGETAKEPAAPTKEGLDFFGWYTKDGELYEFETPVTGNIELYAKFGYTVLFWLDSSDEYAIAWRNVEPGQKAEEQAEPAQEGKIFLGWYTSDGKKFDYNTPINSHLNLYAKFEDEKPAVNTYTVTFDPNGGSVTPTTMVTDADGWLKNLPTPTHSDPNMLFDGWHTNKNSYSQVADKCKFSKDTTLYAHWKAKPAHTVAEVYIESIQTPTPGVMPSNQVTITTAGVHGITDSGDSFWVRYDAATHNLTDTYEDDTHVDSVPFRSGETYLLMLVMEAQTGYGFTPDVKVFYKGVELPAPSMSDMTASAILDHDDEYIFVLINPGKAASTTYTVTFNSDGGSAVATQTVESGKAAAKPADPTKSGYTFKGWYLGSTKYDFSKPVTGNITLKAKWEKKAAAHTHTYTDDVDGTCNGCGVHREEVETRKVVHMFRMYNPNTGEHFYTGSEVEKNNLIAVGWQYEGVGFTFPANTGAPVYRLFQPSTGEHLYTMDEAEKNKLVAEGWNYEGIAFNSAYDTEAVQHRLHNPNAIVGAYHFTFSVEEKQNLINAGWEYQGIGWYSCWK